MTFSTEPMRRYCAENKAPNGREWPPAGDMEITMSEDIYARVLETLHNYVKNIAAGAGWDEERTERFWERACTSEGVMKELAYFHDNGSFWGGYSIAGTSIMDIVVWQVDHFKAYMDRTDKNRYEPERLLLESLETMLEMEEDPEPILKKLREESGTDRQDY